MKKYISPTLPVLATLLVATIWLLLLPATAYSVETTPIQNLVGNMKKYDGELVTIKGEAVGDVMQRGDFAWITVNDDPYSKRSIEDGGGFQGLSNIGIGVWAPALDVKPIKIAGGYKYRGDQVLVTGVFHRACHQHGGDTDIHADSIEIVRQGHKFPHRFQFWKLAIAIFLALIIVALWNLRRSRIKKRLQQR